MASSTENETSRIPGVAGMSDPAQAVGDDYAPTEPSEPVEEEDPATGDGGDPFPAPGSES